jgi:hypothetical protein
MVGTGYGNRKWRDEKITEKKLKYLGEKRYVKKLKTPAQMEKLAGKKNIEDLYTKYEFPKLVLKETTFDSIED